MSLAFDARERELWLYLSVDDYARQIILNHLHQARETMDRSASPYLRLKETPEGEEELALFVSASPLSDGEGAIRLNSPDPSGYTPWLIVEEKLAKHLKNAGALDHHKIQVIGPKLALTPQEDLSYFSVELIGYESDGTNG